jgi:hypothetical protein
VNANDFFASAKGAPPSAGPSGLGICSLRFPALTDGAIDCRSFGPKDHIVEKPYWSIQQQKDQQWFRHP